MRKRITALLATGVVAAGTAAAVFSGTPAHASTITNLPGQPAITDYQPPSGNGSNAVPYEHQGALIVAGQSQLPSQPMKDASAAGATVMGYLDPMVIQPNSGTYGDMLWQSSACGPAVPQWGTKVSGTGYNIADFRTTADGGSGIEQAKLQCVLEKMVSDNPWIGGMFADDLGSKSWYPGLPWSGMSAADQQAWRDGAVALAQTFHTVAVEHTLAFMVNGTWEAGTLASAGGGYPTLATNGLSYADGGYIEHHAASELSFWEAYAQGQWSTATGDVSQGKPFMYVQASDQSTLNTYMASNDFAFGSYQTDYSQPAPVWGSFHATGLPSSAGGGGTTQQAPAVVTSAATGVTSSGATLNGTVNPEGAATTEKFDWGTTTSYGSSTTQGNAGSGTTAVNESAPLTGLTPGETIHYRIEATNSAGTTFGSDQQFTTSAAGSTVAFDAAGGGKVASASSLSWTQAVGSGSNRALTVDFTIGNNNDAGCAPVVKDNGTAMSEITAVHDGNLRNGVLTVWGLVNPPSGTNTITTSVSGCTGVTQELTGGSESFTGVSQSAPWGAHATAFATSGTQSSVAVTSAGTGNLVGEFVANGSAVGTAVSPVVAKFTENQDSNTGAGNTAGGYAPGAAGSVTGKFNLTNDQWGAAAVDVNHA
jgi:hypothetical protein